MNKIKEGWSQHVPDTGEWGASEEAPHRKVGAGGAEGDSQPAGDAQGRQPEEEERHHRPGRNLDSG